MSAWPVVELGSHLRVKHGLAFKGEYFGDSGDFIVLTPGNFYDEGGFKPKDGGEKFYTAEPPAEYVLKRNDLVVAMTEQVQGLLGSSALIPCDDVYLHNQRIGLVELQPDVDRRFIYYLFNTHLVRDQIQATATGSKIRHTAPSRIEAVKVPLPPLATQRKIGSVLSAYDDLIENNRRRINLLEEIAHRIYREWFVDFRYPGHEVVSRVDSELGLVPEGWSVAHVRDIASCVRGRSYRGTNLVDAGGLPFINLKCVNRDGGFRREGVKRYVGPYAPAQAVGTGDIVVAVTDMTQERRIVARAARVPPLDQEYGVISMDLVKVVPQDGIPSDYLLALLRFSSFPDAVKQHANGANVLHLHPDRIGDYCFPRPPRGLMERYGQLAHSLSAEADVLGQAQERLTASRDLLLPRLVSGELDVDDLHIPAEEAAA
jgi:type I restriction enzyme, S subunit